MAPRGKYFTVETTNIGTTSTWHAASMIRTDSICASYLESGIYQWRPRTAASTSRIRVFFRILTVAKIPLDSTGYGYNPVISLYLENPVPFQTDPVEFFAIPVSSRKRVEIQVLCKLVPYLGKSRDFQIPPVQSCEIGDFRIPSNPVLWLRDPARSVP